MEERYNNEQLLKIKCDLDNLVVQAKVVIRSFNNIRNSIDLLEECAGNLKIFLGEVDYLSEYTKNVKGKVELGAYLLTTPKSAVAELQIISYISDVVAKLNLAETELLYIEVDNITFRYGEKTLKSRISALESILMRTKSVLAILNDVEKGTKAITYELMKKILEETREN